MSDFGSAGHQDQNKGASSTAPSPFVGGLRAPAAGLRPPTVADILLGTGALHHQENPQGHSLGGKTSPVAAKQDDGVHGHSLGGKSVAGGAAAGRAIASGSVGGALAGAGAGVGAHAEVDDGQYHSGYTGAFMSGIRNTTKDAKKYDREISGHGSGYGYGVYAPSPTDQQVDLNTTVHAGILGDHTFHKEMNLPLSQLDAVSDIAAVTQYAAAADQAIHMEKGADGKPKVNIDWARLHSIPVQSNMQFDHNGKPIAGSQQITYDSPGAMADKGAAAIQENMKANHKDPKDLNQFVAITGHSGGGQSSFYTALKMASDGYKNVSVVGVDMAMTPQERKTLETMGVKVTNITSNTKDDKGSHSSEIGEFIKIGMGGTDNYYDLNVERQSKDTLAKAGEKPADLLGRHGVDNDANVATMVRFAQQLDATGKHGQFTQEAYQKFLAASKHGNELTMEDTGHKLTADSDLIAKTQDNRGKTGGDHQTEADFQKWFGNFVKQAGVQMLPVPDQIGVGPLQYHAKDDLSNRLGNMASNNSPEMVQMLQHMGVDTTHIQGLGKYNQSSISNHWGKYDNNVEVPLPGWLNVDPVHH